MTNTKFVDLSEHGLTVSGSRCGVNRTETVARAYHTSFENGVEYFGIQSAAMGCQWHSLDAVADFKIVISNRANERMTHDDLVNIIR